jgi:hypothetical protein
MIYVCSIVDVESGKEKQQNIIAILLQKVIMDQFIRNINILSKNVSFGGLFARRYGAVIACMFLRRNCSEFRELIWCFKRVWVLIGCQFQPLLGC